MYYQEIYRMTDNQEINTVIIACRIAMAMLYCYTVMVLRYIF